MCNKLLYFSSSIMINDLWPKTQQVKSMDVHSRLSVFENRLWIVSVLLQPPLYATHQVHISNVRIQFKATSASHTQYSA